MEHIKARETFSLSGFEKENFLVDAKVVVLGSAVDLVHRAINNIFEINAIVQHMSVGIDEQVLRSHKSLTLKQTSKLIGIVKNTSTQDRKIKIFPQVDASALSVSSAENKRREVSCVLEQKTTNCLQKGGERVRLQSDAHLKFVMMR